VIALSSRRVAAGARVGVGERGAAQTRDPIPWAESFSIGRELVVDDDRTSAMHAMI